MEHALRSPKTKNPHGAGFLTTGGGRSLDLTRLWRKFPLQKWVNQYIKDNKDEGAKEEVVKAYCVCMNDNETRSITQWEKANPEARKACEKKAGWK